MNDFWNFNDALIVAQENIVWMILALVIGVVVGWITCVRADHDVTGG